MNLRDKFLWNLGILLSVLSIGWNGWNLYAMHDEAAELLLKFKKLNVFSGSNVFYQRCPPKIQWIQNAARNPTNVSTTEAATLLLQLAKQATRGMAGDLDRAAAARLAFALLLLGRSAGVPM